MRLVKEATPVPEVDSVRERLRNSEGTLTTTTTSNFDTDRWSEAVPDAVIVKILFGIFRHVATPVPMVDRILEGFRITLTTETATTLSVRAGARTNVATAEPCVATSTLAGDLTKVATPVPITERIFAGERTKVATPVPVAVKVRV